MGSTTKKLWKFPSEFSEYEHSRRLLVSSVKDIVKAANINLTGSFLTSSFHLPLTMNYSFSDIDLMAAINLYKNDRLKIKKRIANDLYERFGINFRISIRNIGIFSDITSSVSHAVAMLEALSGFMKKPLDKEYTHYQLAKLYLKIVHLSSYSRNGINFTYGLYNENVLETCCQIKTRGGLFTTDGIKLCVKEIELSSPSVGMDVKSIIDSGVLVEEIYQRYSSVLVSSSATEFLIDLRNKMEEAKSNNDQIAWASEKFRPLF